jgi:hypothetical protein
LPHGTGWSGHESPGQRNGGRLGDGRVPHSEAPLVEAWLKVDRRAATEMGILLIRLTSPKPERVGKADILSLQERSNHRSIDGRILSNLRKDWMPADFVEIRLL